MYSSPRQYPSLVGRSRAARQAILRAALEEYGGRYRIRYAAVFVATAALGISVAASRLGTWLSAAPLSDWRKWAPLVAIIALIYGVYLLEVNGPVHTAVRKYFADRNA